jgi:hypothetical protein
MSVRLHVVHLLPQVTKRLLPCCCLVAVLLCPGLVLLHLLPEVMRVHRQPRATHVIQRV